MRAVLHSHLELHDLSPRDHTFLRRAFTLPNPAYRRAKLFGKGRNPTGGIPEDLCFVEDWPDGSVRLPRGARWQSLIEGGITRPELAAAVVNTEDRRTIGSLLTQLPSPSMSEGFFERLRDYQHEGVRAVLEKEQGLIILPCGCGKTTLGIAILLAVARTSLVIVPSTDLLDQWWKQLSALGLSVGRLGDGFDESGHEITIAVDASCFLKLKRASYWGQQFGVVLVDEAHHVPAARLQTCMALLPACYRVGLTATAIRADGLTEVIDWTFGPRLLEKTTREMIDRGFLMPTDIEKVPTGWRRSAACKDTAGMEKELVADAVRRSIVVERTIADLVHGHTTLVIAGRVPYADALAADLAARGQSVVCLTSKTKKKQRKAGMEAFVRGDIRCLVAPKLGDEGLDVVRLSRIHLAWPGKDEGGTTQRVGRLLRLFSTNPKLIDYVDADPTLVRRAADREAVYRRLFG